MKKQLFLLAGLYGSILIGLQSCNRDSRVETTLYSIQLSQPDGTSPAPGYALIYEKHLDSTTGLASLRVPISDTLRWKGDEIFWSDLRECRHHPITIGCFSPELLTHDALRHEWYPLDAGTPEIELSFIQSRPIRITIRSFHHVQGAPQAWGLLINPTNNILEPFDDTSYSRSHFDDMALFEGNITSLVTQTEFDEFNTLYAHLFRLDHGEWKPNGIFELALHENVEAFEFYTNYTMSCCE
jgi:hypothetical protein